MQVDFTSQLAFPELAREQKKAVVAAFDGGDLTSDGGLLLLSQADRGIGLCAGLARALGDRRQKGKVRHELSELILARVGAIALGYADCNDLNSLREDPALRLFCGRPLEAGHLATQSTLSRLENGVSKTQVLRMALQLARTTIDLLPAHTKLVVVDVDSTDDPCHGQQQFEGFNAFYDNHCYMPLLAHLQVWDEKGLSRRWPMPVLLRPGRIHGTHGVKAALKRIVELLRERFPGVDIIVRADSGFGTEAVLSACEALNVDYVIGLAQNACLHRASFREQMSACLRYAKEKHHWQLMARNPHKAPLKIGQIQNGGDFKDWTPDCPWDGDYNECVEMRSFYHTSDSWSRPRRVAIKAAITHSPRGRPSLNPRFVVTSLSPVAQNPQGVTWKSPVIYRFYCERGEQENRIKEWKLDMDGGRTSCHRFLSNQFRLLLHGAALLLLTLLQNQLPAHGNWATASIATLRLHLLKVAARIKTSCRRVQVQLPTAFPQQQVWQHLWASFSGVPNGPPLAATN